MARHVEFPVDHPDFFSLRDRRFRDSRHRVSLMGGSGAPGAAIASRILRPVDRPRNREDLPVLVERHRRRDHRPAVVVRLHHDRPEGESADDPVPSRKIPLLGPRPGGVFGDHRPRGRDLGCKPAVLRWITFVRTGPDHREGPPARVEGRAVATLSIPLASPLTTVSPAEASSRAKYSAITRPYGVGCRVPTTATQGSPNRDRSPLTKRTGGAS